MFLSRITRSRIMMSSAISASSLRSMATLILADPLVASDNLPSGATCSAVSAAQQFNDSDIYLLVVGDAPPTQVPDGVTKIVMAKSTMKQPTAETVASTTAQVAKSDSSIQRVIGTSTKFGAAIIPRIAGLLQSSPMTDIVSIQDDGASFVRPMYAGNVLTKIKPTAASSSSPMVLSIRPTSFPKAALVDASSVSVEQVSAEEFSGSEWVSDNSGDDVS
jgi:electron transfer flavoprotein alpha subunit